MSTYPPGLCSIDGAKSPRMLVLYTAATLPNKDCCPQSLVCCFSDILQVVVIVCLLSPGIQKCYFNGCFWRFSSKQRYIHSYISFQNRCQYFFQRFEILFQAGIPTSRTILRAAYATVVRVMSI